MNRTLDYRALSKLDLSEILDKAIETVYSGKDWKTVFPDVSGYRIFYPEGHVDMEENPNAFRSMDHAIAHRTVTHPELHAKVIELIKTVTVGNIVGDEVLLANAFEHTGTHYAVELALYDKNYVRLYADFLLTNDIYIEHFQHLDFGRIVRTWGWCNETYFLLFAHMFAGSEYFHDDVNYLVRNGYPLYEGLLEHKEEEDKFLSAFGFFLKEINHDTENEELNANAVELFSSLVGKHIISDNPIFPEEKEKSECLKKRVYEVIEKLKNDDEIIPENNIPGNNLIEETPEEEIAVLGPENWMIEKNSNDTTGITQPTWSWDDEDIPEI